MKRIPNPAVPSAGYGRIQIDQRPARFSTLLNLGMS